MFLSSKLIAPCRSHARSSRQTAKMASAASQEVIDACSEYTLWSWSAQKAVDPIHMVKAEGCYFWDGDGKRYTDLNSQLMCTNIGHQHPKVIKAIQDQAAEMCYAGPAMATNIRAEFGPLLAKHTPGNLNKFFFTLGGAEANENALKFAKLHTGRKKVITRYKAYHGGTHAAMMMTGDPRRWANEPNGMGGIVRVFDPYMYRSLMYREGMTEEEFSAVMVAQLEETILYENPNDIAAMFLETVTGTNGLLPPPKGYLPGVRKVLDKYGIMMVCDEVMCGVGRTGEWFGVDNYDVVPDILTMAKGVTSAHAPLGVVAVKPEIAESFNERPFFGGLTYMGHPLCLSAGVATLKVLEEEQLVPRAKQMGVVLRKHLDRMMDKHPSIGDVRSIGLFSGMELVKNRATKEPLVPYGGSHPALLKMMKFLKDKGLYMFTAQNVFFVNPPFVITEEQLEESFEIIDEALCIVDAEYVG